MTGSEIQKDVIDYMRKNGYLVWKNHNIGVHGRTIGYLKGLPDNFAIKHGRFFAIEIKGESDTIKPEQKKWLKKMTQYGAVAFAANSKQEVIMELSLWRQIPNKKSLTKDYDNKEDNMANDKSRFNIVSLTDMHIPFHDSRAIDVAFKFCKHLQPDIIICHEWLDFYALSRFNQDPLRINGLQEEIDLAVDYWGVLRKNCPASEIINLDSNHQDRLQRFLWSDARALSTLRNLKLDELLQIKKHNIKMRESYTYKKFLFKHSSLVRKFSSYTAKGEYEKEGMSGCSGHTHRLGQYFETKRGGSYTWVESGCLCKTDNVEYINGTANWQQGISLVSFEKGGTRFFAAPIPIIKHEIHFGDIILK